jgi:predicted RNA-binding Zn-ribbon protein involved in translation (DUF1610 family)
MTDQPRILTIDVETAPLELYGWGLFDQNFGLDHLKTDWTILSFAAKWLGDKRVIYGDTGGRGKKKVRDDKKLMKPLWTLLNEADIVIAQNGKKFDVRKINARLIAHGFAPPSPSRVVDTMLVARKYFAFTSQKLKYTSELLAPELKKDEHEEYPGLKLWTAVLEDDPKAWKVMKKYNIRDILATEQVYLNMRAWDQQHPNIGTFSVLEEHQCPHCGSTHVIARGGREVKNQGVYKRYWCNDCHGWSRGKLMLNSLPKRRAQLAY